MKFRCLFGSCLRKLFLRTFFLTFIEFVLYLIILFFTNFVLLGLEVEASTPSLHMPPLALLGLVVVFLRIILKNIKNIILVFYKKYSIKIVIVI